MRAIGAVLIVVWTLLLGAIAFELRRIDDSLMHLSAPNRALATRAPSVEPPPKPETREERIARKRREYEEVKASFEESLEAAGLTAPKGKSATAPPARR